MLSSILNKMSNPHLEGPRKNVYKVPCPNTLGRKARPLGVSTHISRDIKYIRVPYNSL